MSRDCCRCCQPIWAMLTSSSTQLYLTMTPELLHEASKRFAKYVFGEVQP